MSINPKNNPNTNPDLNYKEKNSKKKTLTQKYKIDVAGIRTPNCGMEDIHLDHYDTAQQSTNRVLKRYLTLSLKKESITMVKWTKYCYKRWLWTFGALAELDVVVANINIQLTAFA